LQAKNFYGLFSETEEWRATIIQRFVRRACLAMTQTAARKHARPLFFRDWSVGAGFIRNMVWDRVTRKRWTEIWPKLVIVRDQRYALR